MREQGYDLALRVAILCSDHVKAASLLRAVGLACRDLDGDNAFALSGSWADAVPHASPRARACSALPEDQFIGPATWVGLRP